MTDAPRFLLNGEPVRADGVPATTTLLDWLRGQARLRGTKEGCAEGDCGACTVVLERVEGGEIRRSAVNSCLAMVGQVDGLGVRTIEGLSAGQDLHPVQAAFVEHHASQCGFCTPGFVMAAYAFCDGGEAAEVERIHDALTGNLCRCTGYRPIVDAVKHASGAMRAAREPERALAAALAALARESCASFAWGATRFHAPRTLAEALDLCARRPEARVLAGGTDLNLLASQRREPPAEVLYLGRVAEITYTRRLAEEIVFGAGVTYCAAMETLAGAYPALSTYLERLGSRQIRNMGTLAGNVATASPIGDMLPVLLSLGARIVLRSAVRGEREVSADEFFVGYRRTALAPDELIVALIIPRPTATTVFFADKISKRRDQDISSVCAAYRFEVAEGIVRSARVAYGGLAATPKRARGAELALLGKLPSAEVFEAAAQTLAAEFQPISDWRAGAAYRLRVAQNLLRRVHLRMTRPDRVLTVDEL